MNVNSDTLLSSCCCLQLVLLVFGLGNTVEDAVSVVGAFSALQVHQKRKQQEDRQEQLRRELNAWDKEWKAQWELRQKEKERQQQQQRQQQYGMQDPWFHQQQQQQQHASQPQQQQQVWDPWAPLEQQQQQQGAAWSSQQRQQHQQPGGMGWDGPYDQWQQQQQQAPYHDNYHENHYQQQQHQQQQEQQSPYYQHQQYPYHQQQQPPAYQQQQQQEVGPARPGDWDFGLNDGFIRNAGDSRAVHNQPPAHLPPDGSSPAAADDNQSSTYGGDDESSAADDDESSLDGSHSTWAKLLQQEYQQAQQYSDMDYAYQQQLNHHVLWCQISRQHLLSWQQRQQQVLQQQQQRERSIWIEQQEEEQQQQQDVLLLKAMHFAEQRQLLERQAVQEQSLLASLGGQWSQAIAEQQLQLQELEEQGLVWLPVVEEIAAFGHAGYLPEGLGGNGGSGGSMVRERWLLPYWEVEDEQQQEEGEEEEGEQERGDAIDIGAGGGGVGGVPPGRGGGVEGGAIVTLEEDELEAVREAVRGQQQQALESLQEKQEKQMVDLVRKHGAEIQLLWKQQGLQWQLLAEWHKLRRAGLDVVWEFQRQWARQRGQRQVEGLEERQQLVRDAWVTVQEGEVKGLHTMHRREVEVSGAAAEVLDGELWAAPGGLLLAARQGRAREQLQQQFRELEMPGVDWEAWLRLKMKTEGWEGYGEIQQQVEELLAGQERETGEWEEQQRRMLEKMQRRYDAAQEARLQQLLEQPATKGLAMVLVKSMNSPPMKVRPDPSRGGLSPREVMFCEKERVGIDAAVGRRSGELVCPYPPGVPLLFPGELVTEKVIGVLRDVLASGGVVTGASDTSCGTLLVLKEGGRGGVGVGGEGGEGPAAAGNWGDASGGGAAAVAR